MSLIRFSGRIMAGDALPPSAAEGELFYLIPAHTYYYWDGTTWVALGGTSGTTTATNIGTGTGEIFESKVGAVIRLRTLKNNDGKLSITTSGDEVLIETVPGVFVEDAANVGAGAEVFRDKTGSTLNFRTLFGASGIDVNTVGDTIELSLSPSGPDAAVVDGQNLGGGYEVFHSKSGNRLQFRTLEDTGGGEPIIEGYGIDTIRFRGIESSDGSVQVSSSGGAIDLRVEQQNIGPGLGLYQGVASGVHQLKSLLAGLGIALTNNVDHLVISSTAHVEAHSEVLLSRDVSDAWHPPYDFNIAGGTVIPDQLITVPAGAVLLIIELELHARAWNSTFDGIDYVRWLNPFVGSMFQLWSADLPEYDTSATNIYKGRTRSCGVGPCDVHSYVRLRSIVPVPVSPIPTSTYAFYSFATGLLGASHANDLEFASDEAYNKSVVDLPAGSPGDGPNLRMELVLKYKYVVL